MFHDDADQRFYCQNCFEQDRITELWEGDECDECRTNRLAIEAENRRLVRYRKNMKKAVRLRVKAFVAKRVAA